MELRPDENDSASGISIDKDGNAIIIGTTSSTNFPVANALQSTLGGSNDAFITKLNANGSTLLWSTYLGGRGSDVGIDLSLGKSGSIYVGGYTTSTNFPTLNADFANLRGQTDAFVTKLKGDGSALEYSTYFGGSGSDFLYGMALDVAENVYFTGTTNSTDFPQIDPAQIGPLGQFSSNDIFAVKLSPTKTAAGFSTLLGGNSTDVGYGIAVDAVNQVYLTGYTASQYFPIVNAYQPQYRGSSEAFFMKLGIEADVSVTQTQVRNPVMIDNEQTYTVTVTNNGPSPATAVKLKDILPAGLSFISATPAKGTCTNTAGTINCDLGTMALNDKINVVIKVKPTTAGKITHTVSVSTIDPDSAPANNSSSLETTVSNSPSIIGRVTNSTGAGIQGVKISLTGSATNSATTDGDGNYQLNELALNGNYSLMATKTNYSFEPPFTAFTNLNADQTANFAATVCAYTLYPTSQDFMLAGGGNTISVIGTARCPWTATVSPESASWLKITSGALGIGNGTITYTVAPSTVPRSGFIRAANQTFIVFQHGESTCTIPSFLERDFVINSQYNYGYGLNKLISSDINKDGNPDLIYGITENSTGLNQPASFIKIQYGDGKGNFPSSSSILVSLGSFANPTLIADTDFNNDKNVDILTIDTNNGKILVLQNDGTGKFTKKVSDIGISGVSVVADLNMDQLPDLLSTTNAGGAGYNISLNNGDGTFSPAYTVNFNGSGTIYGVDDFTGDGIPDVIARGAGSAYESIAIYPGDGIGSFGVPLISPNPFLTLSGSYSISGETIIGDFVSDGKPDLAFIVSRFDNGSSFTSLVILPGKGDGSFDALVSTSFPNRTQLGRLIKTDFNGDARTDLISLGQTSTMLTNDGTGKFAIASSFTSTSFLQGIADFNKDGKVDLFGILQSNPIGFSVFQNGCGAAISPTILGRVIWTNTNNNLANATVKLSGAATATTKTDIWGNYQFTGLTKGANYTVKIDGAGIISQPNEANIVSLTDEQRADFSIDKTVVAVSATTYIKGPIAKGSIISIFGNDMTDVVIAATTFPLPTELGGVSATVAEMPAKLLYVSPNQINLQLPEDLVTGTLTIRVSSTKPFVQNIIGSIDIVPNAGGLFSANSDGKGAVAATVIYVTGTRQTFDTAATCLPGQSCTTKPIDLRSADNVYLELYGTGMRFNISQVKAEIAGIDAEVVYNGSHCCFAGLDQVNVKIPKLLVARGEVDLRLLIDGAPTNTVKIFLK